ncbi:MAG: alpha/beta hydrolase-fold protein [Fibrobacterota bacterium]
MKLITCLQLLCFLAIGSHADYHDHSHVSAVLGTTKYFRVFYPPTYSAANTATRYPVIYYNHGSGGSYQGDSYPSYLDPVNGGNCHSPISDVDPVMSVPFNGDFELAVRNHDVIIVTTDQLVGDNTGDNSSYIRELVGVVDNLYNTNPSPAYRAMTGLSMGGHASIWLGSSNADLFSSISQFCHSPHQHTGGAGSNNTPIDPRELWRNLRGMPFRSSTNYGDYLIWYTYELGSLFNHAGVGPYEYHQTSFFRHWAADVDSQVDFHLAHFGTVPAPACFSVIQMDSTFDYRGYHIQSNKAEAGWIYLRDATANGFGVCTRKQLPFGKGLSLSAVTVTTPPVYQASQSYTVTRYLYRSNTFQTGSAIATAEGKLSLACTGGQGEEVGIIGPSLNAPVALVADTLFEDLYINANADTVISVSALNLSQGALSGVEFRVATSAPCLSVVRDRKAVDMPALSKVAIDTLAVIRGNYIVNNNIGYLQVVPYLGGVKQDKESYLRVHVMNVQESIVPAEITVLDGKSASLATYHFSWNGAVYTSAMTVSGATTGNQDGVADSGEVVAIWVKLDSAVASNDVHLWHPAELTGLPRDGSVTYMGDFSAMYSRGRSLHTTLFRLNRTPTLANPIYLPIRSEAVYEEPRPGTQRGNVDYFRYYYGTIAFPVSVIAVEKKEKNILRPFGVEAFPNPVNPGVVIRINGLNGDPVDNIEIFSANGRRVTVLEKDGASQPTTGKDLSLRWKGDDINGRPVPSGQYIVRVRAGARVCHTKVVLLR